MKKPFCSGSLRTASHRLTVAIFLCVSSVGWGDTNDIVEADVAKKIRQLGAGSFVARETATQQLLQLGETAEQALIEASENSDREIRARSQRVLALVRQNRRADKLAAFRQSGQLLSKAQQHSLPGWEEFSERYGNDLDCRNTFARMFESEWNLLTEYFSDAPPNKRKTLTSARHQRLQQAGLGNQNYSVGTMLTFFFLATEHPTDFELHGHVYTFVRHRAMQPLLLSTLRSDAAERQLVRKMIGDWILAASGPHISDRIALQTALYYKMHNEGSIIAKRVLTDNNALPMSKSMAMQAIVLRDDKSQIGLIEPYLEDKTHLGTTGKRVRQLRDVALASLMRLNGHDVRKIGLTPINATHGAFSYSTLGFISEADREKAFKIYRDLQAAKQASQSKNDK